MTVAAPAPLLPSGESLFSRHYPPTHLPYYAEWTEDPGPTFARLAELWARTAEIVRLETQLNAQGPFSNARGNTNARMIAPSWNP